MASGARESNSTRKSKSLHSGSKSPRAAEPKTSSRCTPKRRQSTAIWEACSSIRDSMNGPFLALSAYRQFYPYHSCGRMSELPCADCINRASAQFVASTKTSLDIRPHFSYIPSPRSLRAPFRKGKPERRSEGRCPRADIANPLPGGPGPLMALRSSRWTLIDFHSMSRRYSLTEIAQVFHCCLVSATYLRSR